MNLNDLLKDINRFAPAFDDVIKAQNYQMQILKRLYERNNLQIVKTCSAFPEQYDVGRYGKQVAYYRLRDGEFRVDATDCGGVTLYEAETNGDGYFDADERLFYMTRAMRIVLQHINF